jgi:hypothetical protein
VPANDDRQQPGSGRGPGRAPSGVEARQRRKRRPAGPPARDPAPAPASEPLVEQTRSQLRDQAARDALAPLGPDERPPALLAAVVVCCLLGAANLIAYAAGARIGGRHPGAGVLAFSAVMALLGGGMWARRYLAVLAFEALLAVTVAFFSLFLVEASNVEGLLLCVGVIGAGGWLFWKLVRVMGRLSAPRQSSA